MSTFLFVTGVKSNKVEDQPLRYFDVGRISSAGCVTLTKTTGARGARSKGGDNVLKGGLEFLNSESPAEDSNMRGCREGGRI